MRTDIEFDGREGVKLGHAILYPRDSCPWRKALDDTWVSIVPRVEEALKDGYGIDRDNLPCSRLMASFGDMMRWTLIVILMKGFESTLEEVREEVWKDQKWREDREIGAAK